MGERTWWQRRVEEFVLDQIGDAAARVLKVGCGEGELARALTLVGHPVTAIDPRAPQGPIFRRARIEEFSDPGMLVEKEAPTRDAWHNRMVSANRSATRYQGVEYGTGPTPYALGESVEMGRPAEHGSGRSDGD